MKWIDVKHDCDDLDKKVSVRGFMYELLKELWTEFEGFSGKRPFGNSGWEYWVYTVMIKEGIIKGKLDEDGFIEDIDENKAHKIIMTKVLPFIFKPPLNEVMNLIPPE